MPLIRTPPPSLLLAASRGPAKDSRLIGYEAAAYLYGFDAFPTLTPAFIVPHGTWRRGPYDHQRRRIDDIEFVELEGLLITSVRQTLGDLCSVADLDLVERAVESALRSGLVDEPSLRDFAWLFAYWRHGTPGLLDVLDRRPIGAPPTGSDLETLYLQCVRGHVPDPIRQQPVYKADGAWVANVDFSWWATRFVVETDGVEFHKTPEQVLYDTTRQNAIIDAGYNLRRFTHRHVTRVPAYVIRETQAGLARAALDLSKMRKRTG
ncbi:MAG TPA: DUF559 domain-containing protein [Acidimicrobiales bacterium]|nr:DUF559 domain-containing protein [Acidimicrobiales bacterium]